MEDLTARIIAALRKAAQNARNADEAGEPTALADALEAGGSIAFVAPMTGEPPPQPPVDNDHVAPGAEPFSDEVIAANKPAPPAEDNDAQ